MDEEAPAPPNRAAFGRRTHTRSDLPAGRLGHQGAPAGPPARGGRLPATGRQPGRGASVGLAPPRMRAEELGLLQPDDIVEAERWQDSWYTAKVVSVSDDQTSCNVRFPGFSQEGVRSFTSEQIRTSDSGMPASAAPARQRTEASISRLQQRGSQPVASATDPPWVAMAPSSRAQAGPDYGQQSTSGGYDDGNLQAQIRSLELAMSTMSQDMRDERVERENLEDALQRDVAALGKRLDADHSALTALAADVKADAQQTGDEQARLSKQAMDMEGLFEELAEMVTDVEGVAKEALEGEHIQQLQNDSSDAKDAIELLMDLLEKTVTGDDVAGMVDQCQASVSASVEAANATAASAASEVQQLHDRLEATAADIMKQVEAVGAEAEQEELRLDGEIQKVSAQAAPRHNAIKGTPLTPRGVAAAGRAGWHERGGHENEAAERTRQRSGERGRDAGGLSGN